MEEFLIKAKNILINNNIGTGIKAGDYYPDLWVRDALISSLGMCLSEDDELISLAKTTINTISKHQKWTGQIPNKISPDERKICFGEGGCVDSSLWYPIAVFEIFKSTKDYEFLKVHHKKVNSALKWALSLDQNNDWLIEVNEGADWMDLLIRSGRILYDNVLLYKALKVANKINKIVNYYEDYEWIAENVKENINLLLWPDKKKEGSCRYLTRPELFSRVCSLLSASFFLLQSGGLPMS